MFSKKRVFCTIFSVLLFCILSIVAFADGNITSCGSTIDTSGWFELNETIPEGINGNCITINRGNVTLDCKGFTINGSSAGAGIYINDSTANDVNNVTIQNCNVTKFATAYYISGGHNITIRDSAANNNSVQGIYFVSTDDSAIENNSLQNNNDQSTAINYGIYLLAGAVNNNVINNTVIYNGENGIFVSGSSNNNILLHNRVRDHEDFGIVIETCSYNILRNNTANNNTLDTSEINAGIILITSSNFNNVSNNTLYDNGYGIYLSSSHNNTIEDHSSVYNNTYGFVALNSGDNNFKNNILTNNTYGILFQSSAVNTLQDNNVSESSIHDFRIITSTSCQLINNSVSINDLPTTFTITDYSGDFNVSGISTHASVLPYRHVSKFLNISSANYLSLILTYDFSIVNSENIVESSLDLFEYTSGAWSASSATLNSNANTLTANLTSFSEFGALGSPDCGNLYNDTTLLANVELNATCFNMSATNITLDCMNFSITGNQSSTSRGVYINVMHNITVKNCHIYNYTSGIYLNGSENNTFLNNNVRYCYNSLDNDGNSNLNTFILNNITESISNAVHLENGINNKFIDTILTEDLHSTSFSFAEYNASVHLTGVPSPATDPSGVRNISKYVNITKTDNDWVLLNISYSDADISGITESSLSIYRYNGSVWNSITSTVVAADNVVYSNISEFSDFGVFGSLIPTTTGGGGGGASAYSTGIGGVIYEIELDYDSYYTTGRISKDDSLSFKINTQKHSLTVKEAVYTTKKVTIEIASIPKQYTLELNIPLQIDSDLNGHLDLEVITKEIGFNYAIFDMKKIKEPVIETIQEPVKELPLVEETIEPKTVSPPSTTPVQYIKKKGNKGIWILASFAVIIILAVLFWFYEKKQFTKAKQRSSMRTKKASSSKNWQKQRIWEELKKFIKK